MNASFIVTIHHAEPEAAMERVSVARMATAKLQGWIHAACGMGVSGSVTTELNSYVLLTIFLLLLGSASLRAEGLSPAQRLEAEQLLHRLGCLGCHDFNASGANLAPSLDRIGLKLDENAIFKQLDQPPAALGSGEKFMPSYQTTPVAQRRLLSRFLANRK